MRQQKPERNRQRGKKNAALRSAIETHARSIGFDLVGFSPAQIAKRYLKAFDKWLAAGNQGTMSYMQKIEKRRDLTRILPGAKSVIVLATNYYREQAELKSGHGIVARYAYGRDYHRVIGKKLKQLEKFIQKLAVEKGLVKKAPPAHSNDSKDLPEVNYARRIPKITKAYVDTGPLLERALAEQAGLGRIGKNGCLITREFGSWVFLSEIITVLDLTAAPVLPTSHRPGTGTLCRDVSAFPPDCGATARWKPFSTIPSNLTDQQRGELHKTGRWSDPAAPPGNICGNCTRCMDACPTGAIIAPGVIDARLCISYLTIENKNKIPPRLAKIIAKTKRLYGCDICQEVCPHNNARQRTSKNKALNSHRIAGSQLSLNGIAAIKTDQAFLETFAGSPLMRVKKSGLRRNAAVLTKAR